MVNTVLKSLRILEELAYSGEQGVTQLSRKLSIPKSTTYSILESLEATHVVERSATSQKFHLGTKLIELGNRAQQELDIYQIARPFLENLNRRVDETVHLTLLDNDEVLYVDCIESRKRLRTYSVIGVRAPLHCTSVGKAMLAFLPATEQQRIVAEKGLPRFTANTITDTDRLERELRAIQEHGYAVDNAEHEEHLRCIGAPIRNAQGEVLASVSLSGPSQRIGEDRLADLGADVVRTADGISAKLGYSNERRTAGTPEGV